ncbi:hypothetical protein K503DRAFT_720162 [Rhizopogon vinicolor AM-OR11-026]|uniref:C2H2-type domain-containing protein n=1 Tax=Rhizopogon vinicolor AM-OR11-026 TaxID=1314800 RepID=A0A1B7MXA4_9AGAM|nr:hypothetical protein K503DRAFT_720162 [Rhizopogon vinicolor AM-OR11-026]
MAKNKVLCPICPGPPTKANSGHVMRVLEHIKKTHLTSTSTICEQCQRDCTTIDELASHLAFKKHHQCQVPNCFKKFMTVTDLGDHTSTAHPGIVLDDNASSSLSQPVPEAQAGVSFECSSCKQWFPSENELSCHAQSVHPPTTAKKAYPCDLCDQTFSKKSKRTAHAQSVHPPTTAKKTYPCDLCDQTFSKKSKRTAHVVIAHPPGPVCAICRFACPSQQILDDHVAAVHPTCVECNLGFEDDAVYATHRQTSHLQPTPIAPSPASHSCPFCERSFKFPNSLNDHMAAIHPFTCGMCNFTCPKEELLQEHIASTHSCPICHEGIFATTALLIAHLVDHATPYRCEVCQTGYAHEEDLQLHYRDSPDGVHPSCAKCDLSFQDAADYYNHTESVHPQVCCEPCDGAVFDLGELPMHYLTSRNHPECDICQTGFSDRTEFATHGAMEHSEVYCYLCQWQFESDQESIASAESPEANSPVMKLPERGTSLVSSSGWSTLSSETASKVSLKPGNSPNQQPTDPAVPMLRFK